MKPNLLAPMNVSSTGHGVHSARKAAGGSVPWALVLLTAAALSACGPAPEPAAKDPVVYVQALDQGAQGSSAVQAVLQATVRAHTETDVAFRAGGQVVQRLVEVGQAVSQGQVLAVLDLQDLQAQQQASTAAAQSARSELLQAQREVARLERLQGTGASAEVDLERQRARLQGLQERQEQLEQQQRLAAQRRSYGELKAPYDGVLTAWRAEPGTVVAEGQPVGSVARTGAWDVVADVGEAHWVLIKTQRALQAQVTIPAAGLVQVPVTLRDLSPLAQGAAGAGRVYRVRFSLPKPLAAASKAAAPVALALGMHAEISLTTASSAPAAAGAADRTTQRLPASALLQDGRQAQVWAVQKLEDGRGRLQGLPVTVVRQGSGWVELQGLPANASVVTLGAQRLREGQTVRPVAQPLSSMADERTAGAR